MTIKIYLHWMIIFPSLPYFLFYTQPDYFVQFYNTLGNRIPNKFGCWIVKSRSNYNGSDCKNRSKSEWKSAFLIFWTKNFLSKNIWNLTSQKWYSNVYGISMFRSQSLLYISVTFLFLVVSKVVNPISFIISTSSVLLPSIWLAVKLLPALKPVAKIGNVRESHRDEI